MSGRTLSHYRIVRFLIAICLLIIAPAPVFGREDSAAELIGLWGSERVFGPEIRGELTILQQGSRWRAYIAGFEAPVRFDDSELNFVLAGDRGEFRGRLTEDGTKILGHWIQPEPIVNRIFRYATPVELTATQSHVWRGQVVPLDDRLSLYLVIQPQQDGSVGAFLRNPERNIGIRRRYRLGQVVRQGDVVRLVGRGGTGNLLVGHYDEQADRLSIFSPFYGTTFDFSRRGRNEATGFYARTPASNPYVYRPPLSENDGWTTASLTDVGLDPKPILALVERILLTKTEDVTTPYIQGLLIARHGKLVLEEYFYGFHKERPHDTRSAGKSLASTLVGIALDQGAPFAVTTPVYSLFPEYTDFAHEDPRKRKITVEHLLTMTAGYDCDDNDPSSAGNENRMRGQPDQPDWYKYTLDLPMAHNPGEHAIYCTAGINLLGGIVSNTTGTWLPDFFYTHFAVPLDIRRYHFKLMPLGDGWAGGNHMRLRDFLKLGQLFLAGGRWNGRQVVSQQWVKRATQPHSSIKRESDYGYAWWIIDYRVGANTYCAFYASGNGGQLVIVIPELDLVVMFAGGNYNNAATWRKFRDELVPQFIIPSARRQ